MGTLLVSSESLQQGKVHIGDFMRFGTIMWQNLNLKVLSLLKFKNQKITNILKPFKNLLGVCIAKRLPWLGKRHNSLNERVIVRSHKLDYIYFNIIELPIYHIEINCQCIK